MCTLYYINFCLGPVSFSLLCETKLITIKINSFQKPRASKTRELKQNSFQLTATCLEIFKNIFTALSQCVRHCILFIMAKKDGQRYNYFCRLRL